MTRWGVLVVLFWAVGCDTLCDDCAAARTPATCLEPAAPSPFPLAVGNWWRYRLTDPKTLNDKDPNWKLWIVESVDPGGDVQFHVVEGEKAGKRYLRLHEGRIEWLRRNTLDEAGRVTQEKTYDPPALRLDLSEPHACNGDTWSESHGVASWSGDKEPASFAQTETWTVRGVHTAVYDELMDRSFDSFCVERESDIPAPLADGTVPPIDGGTGTFCFAYGIGKVYESTQEEIETLERFCVGDPKACCGSVPSPPAADRALCAGECFDLEREAAHCGACDHACGDGESCIAGACTPRLAMTIVPI